MSYALHRADARALPLASSSVDLIVTSPPYFALRSYQDDGEHYAGQIGSEPTPADFLRALWAVLDECWRVLKPSGSCFVNLGDKFASTHQGEQGGSGQRADRSEAKAKVRRLTDLGGARAKSRMLLPHRFALGAIDPDYRSHVEGRPGDWPQWVLRMDLVWAKPNGLPESVTDRVRASHEYWFHLTREGRYFAAVDEVREEHVGKPPDGAVFGGIRNGNTYDAQNPLGKLPGSVWSIPSESLRVPDHLPQHFAAFPSEWPRRLIAGWSPTGICTRCDEPRRPVVAKELVNVWHDKPLAVTRYEGTHSEHQHNRMGQEKAFGSTAATITGYSCACPQPDAATRPAVVLDPFVGTGTTVAVAHHLGRHGIGIDLSADYLRLARWRCTQDWALRNKITGSKPDTTDPDQLTLFALA